MKSPAIMFAYAAFLLVCGFGAWALSGFDERSRTAIFSGAGTAVLMFVCGLMARLLHTNRTVGMIGIHVGMVLPLAFAGVFGWRAVIAWQGFSDGTKSLYLPVLLSTMSLVSLVVFVLILKTRPAPDKRT